MTYPRIAFLPILVLAVGFTACSKQTPKSSTASAGQADSAAPGAGPNTPAPPGDPTMARSHAAESAPAPDMASARAMSIADVWADRKSLAGKTVTVSGKVVKYNGGILGKNWIHLQDGTGKADDHTNDLAVTSTDETQVGDSITVTGVVGVDRDFTAGYQYAVMLENARISKK